MLPTPSICHRQTVQTRLSANLRTFAAMNFDLRLREERVKPHQVTALHLVAALVLTGAGALLSLFQPASRVWSLPLLVAGIALLLTVMMRNKWITKPPVSRSFRIAELLVLATLTVFALFNQWTPPAVMFGVAAAAVLFALYWEGNTAAMTIHIDDTGVHLPLGTAKRQVSWMDVDEVLLKYGTFTVNCADNRMYQWTVNAVSFDEAQFVEFCDRQIEAAKLKRDKNEW